MTTPLSLKGLATGAFWPEGTLPDYSTPGDIVLATVDAQGNVSIRGPVTTDEGGFRDGFGSAPLSGDFVQTAVNGGSIAITGAAPNQNLTFQIANASPATARAYITRTIDYMPLALNVSLVGYARVPASNVDFFIGLYSDPNVGTAIASGSYVEWLFTAGGAANNATLTSQYNPGKREQTVGATVTSTATTGFRSIILDGESAIMRDNTTTLPTTSTRATFSVGTPGLYTPLYLGVGLRASAAVGALQAVSLQAIFAKNSDRLVVNTAW